MEEYILKSASPELISSLKLRFTEISDFLNTYYENNKLELPIWISKFQHAFTDADINIAHIDFPIKADDSIRSETDFVQILSHVDYFDIRPYPDSLIMHCMVHKSVIPISQNLRDQCAEEKRGFYDFFLDLANKVTIYKSVIHNIDLFSEVMREFIVKNLITFDDEVVNFTIKNGKLDFLKTYCCEGSLRFDYIDNAIQYGQLEIYDREI